MKVVRFSVGDKVYSGVIERDPKDSEKEVVIAFEAGDIMALPQTHDELDTAKGTESWPLEDVRLLAPVLPSKIIGIGLNYAAHAAEFSKDAPQENPLIFMKPSTAVIGPEDDIVLPDHMSQRVDYEGELAIVIGKRTRNVNMREAEKNIFGYTCINDITARDLQGKDKLFTRAKGFDTFAPLGPWIETSVEYDFEPQKTRVETFLNGERRQDATALNMMFNIFELICFISKVMTLLPGDVIASGTPAGVGPMKAGDRVEVRIGGIGSLFNNVVGPQD
jgi:2-keto-4-pentenoate hydratase/2-oxohepta-3-ene-1,7-dioic acid hydratase in catechol pathway